MDKTVSSQGNQALRAGARSLVRWTEAPTWLLIFLVYGGWGGLTWFHDSIAWWLLAPAGAWLIALHGSLQHEALHRHPTRHAWLNALLVGAPLGLWMPYPIYRDSHLAHHATASLTDPLGDPESYYAPREDWENFGWLRRAVLTINNTLAGRMVVGPWLASGTLWRAEARRLAAGDYAHARVWAVHLALCALLFAWIVGVCGMAAPDYVLLVAWPGLALLLVRSFLEHRPAASQDRRTVIVEAGWLMSLLFLNNNLHVVHHEHPAIPWYELPAIYRAERNEILARNGNYLFAGGYAEIARRYAFRPKDLPVHPGLTQAAAD